MITLKYWVERLLYGKGLATLLRAYRQGVLKYVSRREITDRSHQYRFRLSDTEANSQYLQVTTRWKLSLSDKIRIVAVEIKLFENSEVVHEFEDRNYIKLVNLVKASIRNETKQKQKAFDDNLEQRLK